MSATLEDSNYLTETEISTLLAEARKNASLGTALGQTKALQEDTQAAGLIRQIESSPQASLATQISSAIYLEQVDQIAAPLIGNSSSASADSITAFDTAYSNAISAVEAVQSTVTNPTQSSSYGTFANDINLGKPVTVTAPDGIAVLGAPTAEKYTFENLGGGQVSTTEILNSGTYVMTENAADLSPISLAATFTDGTKLTTAFKPDGSTITDHINSAGTVTEIDTNNSDGSSQRQVLFAGGGFNDTIFSDLNQGGVITSSQTTGLDDNISGTVTFFASGLGLGFLYLTDSGDTIASFSVQPNNGNTLGFEFTSNETINLADVPLVNNPSDIQGSYTAVNVDSASPGSEVIVNAPTPGWDFSVANFGTIAFLNGTLGATQTVAFSNGTDLSETVTAGPNGSAIVEFGAAMNNAGEVISNGTVGVMVNAGTTADITTLVSDPGTITTVSIAQSSGTAVVSGSGTISDLEVNGTLALNNGSITIDPATVGSSGVVTGFGAITGGPIVNKGTIHANGGALTLSSVTGAGALIIDPGATLVATGNIGPDQTIIFGPGLNEVLDLGTDTVVEGTVDFNTINGGTITGAGTVAVLDVNGVYELNGSTVVADSLDVGVTAGSGAQLGLTDGAKLDVTGNAVIADNGTGTGLVASNSTLSIGGTLTVGNGSNGELSILSGGLVTATGGQVGNAAGSSGNIDLEGANSKLAIDGELNVGGVKGGPGVVTVGIGTTLDVTQTIVIGPLGMLNNLGGTVDPDTLLIQSSIAGLGLNQAGVVVENLGTINISNGTGTWNTPLVQTGTSAADAANNIASGTQGFWVIGHNGTLIMNTNSVDAGQVIFLNDPSASLIIGQQVVGGTGVNPTVAAGAPNVLPNFNAQIWGYQAGNSISFNGLNVASTQIVNGNTVDLFDNNQNLLGALAFYTNHGATGVKADTEAALAAAQITAGIPCFLAGTKISTPKGEVSVENLRNGDTVLTTDGSEMPIIWVGTGQVSESFGHRDATTPIIIKKGAFEDNVPNRDLRVTKGHSFYIDGVLIPAEFLVNHSTIRWDDGAQGERFFHIALPAHAVILANGTPAESYRNDGNLNLFHNAASTTKVDLPQDQYAPVHTGGPIVDAVWRRLADRAGPRPGLPLTTDPDLHLMVNGEQVDGKIHTRADGSVRYVFPLTGSQLTGNDAHLVSRSVIPQELRVTRDPRCLGVAVHQIHVAQSSELRVLEAADELLNRGFHKPETLESGQQIRWTNGNAPIPQKAFAGLKDGTCTVEVLLGCKTAYLDERKVTVVAGDNVLLIKINGGRVRQDNVARLFGTAAATHVAGSDSPDARSRVADANITGHRSAPASAPAVAA